MNREKCRSQPEIADDQAASIRDCRKWLLVYNLGFFLVFLGLFNPLLWVSVHSGANHGIILMNAIYTGLLAALGITVMRIGRRLARERKCR